MPGYLRWKLPGATYFFTIVTQRRRWLFAHAQYRRILGGAFRSMRRKMPFEIDAVVLLPDHLHVLLRPQSGVDYSKLWRGVKSKFTKDVLAIGADSPFRFGVGRRIGEADVWQRRFYEHTIRDEDDWGRHVDYVHWTRSNMVWCAGRRIGNGRAFIDTPLKGCWFPIGRVI